MPLEAIVATGVRGAPDVSALASRTAGRLAVMVWHYHDDDVAGPDAAVDLQVRGLPAAAREATVTHERIDENHSNAYAAWKRMGSPLAPNREQYEALKAAGALGALEPPTRVPLVTGTATLRFALPRQAVSLLVLEWNTAGSN